MSYTRYAIYYLPPEGELALFGASWLGWDVAAGCEAQLRAVEGLEQVVRTPRKYGFHATLKAPFRLADGVCLQDLRGACEALSRRLSPAQCDGLKVTALGRFLALTLKGETQDMSRIAASCVMELDCFRAPLTPEELVRRRKSGLSPEQDALLLRWGYPHVLGAFRFHMTLTGRIPRAQLCAWRETLKGHLPELPKPFVLDQIALVGERDDGQFELIERFALGA